MIKEDRFLKLQMSFHESADSKRFYNRLRNPYIVSKEERLAKLIALRFPRQGTKLLEIGCGEGSNLHYLRQFLPSVGLTGIDFSKEKVDFLRSNYSDVAVICCNADSLPFNDNKYDFVLCRDLLHHVHFVKKQVIAEAFRVLRYGGVVVILESDGRRLLNRIFSTLIPSERGMNYSKPQALLSLVAGFGETELIYIEASFLVRAVAFLLGWPKQSILRHLALVVYALARLWERGMEVLLSKNCWTYMMVTLKKVKE